MIYGLTRVVVQPGKMAEFKEIQLKELIPVNPKVGLKMVGSWQAYTGNMNELFHLFVYNDLAELQKVREASRQNKEYQAGTARLNALRVSQINAILEPNSWLLALNWKEGEKYSFYQFGEIVLVPGKMAEWAEISKNDVTFYAKIGAKWIGSWHGYTGDMNKIYNLFAYKDLAEMQKIRTAALQNPQTEKHSPMMMSRQLNILEPNAWSPMK